MLIEIFSYDLIQRAITAVIAISIFAPILGTFLVLRHQSLMSNTPSHVSLASAALGILLGTSTTWSTILVVTIAVVILRYLQTVYKYCVKVSITILMLLGLAISLTVTSRSKNGSSINLDQYLSGSTIMINMGQIIALFTIAIVVMPLTILFIRPMYILIFGEEIVFIDGLPVRLMPVLFNIMTGIMIALTIPATGALLVSTIITLPASIAMHSGKNFKSVTLVGVVVGFIGMMVGIITSCYWETSASTVATVILMGILLLMNLFNMISHRNS